MGRPDPGLELLLPDAPPELWQRARSVATFLRALTSEARQAPACAVDVDLQRARGELERHVQVRLVAALEGLLGHYLGWSLGDNSFASWIDVGQEVQALWSVLEDHRGQPPGASPEPLPHVPLPGEAAPQVATRLMEALPVFALDPARAELWSGRRAWALEGPRSAEPVLRALWEQHAARAVSSRAARRVALDLGECLLDRGAVGAAAHWLDERLAAAPDDLRLGWLGVWTRLALGDVDGARTLRGRLEAWSGRLPGPLAALREAWPEQLALLPGRTSVAVRRGCAATTANVASLRRAVGACLAAHFRLRPWRSALSRGVAGGDMLVALDVAPGLRRECARWREERLGACVRAGELEHELVARARVAVVHRTAEAALPGAIERERVRAIALVPIGEVTEKGDHGEVVGWLRLEFEHHLVPAADVLIAWARTFHRTAGAGAQDAEGDDTRGTSEILAAASPEADVFRRFVEALQLKTHQRRWWGFELDGNELRRVSDGGRGLEKSAPGDGHGLRRALRSRGSIGFDEPDARFAQCAAAGSGHVVPLLAGGRVRGLWVVESARRHDFAPSTVARIDEHARTFGARLCEAQFRGWHRERFGADVAVELPSAEWRATLDDVLAAGRSREPVVLCGPTGSGRRHAARWLHWESDDRERPWRMITCREDMEGDALRSEWERGGTLVLQHLELLPRSRQLDLLALIEGAGPGVGARWVVLVDTPVSTTGLGSAGAAEPTVGLPWHADLARRLQRVQIFVPALSERREDLPRLVDVLIRRSALSQGAPVCRLDDDALGLLWRQTWSGNVAELENWVYKLVLHHAGESVGVEPLRRLARRYRLPLLKRLPSRHPEPRVVRAALVSTLTGRGTLNRTRAAAYLGWDPDTLKSRLRDFGWEGDRPPESLPDGSFPG